MKKFALIAFVLFTLVLTASSGPAFAQSAHAITEDSAGVLKVGMTVAEARSAMKGYKFTRTSDGEGLALIEVSKGGAADMVLFAGEEDPDGPIDPTAKIEVIDVMGKSYATAQGVSPGMSVAEAARKLGGLEEIMISEIESREYATFVNMPGRLNFRLTAKNGFAGIYEGGASKTRKYQPGAYIYSISIYGGGKVDDEVGDAAQSSGSVMELVMKLAGEFSETRSRSIEIKGETAEDPDKLQVIITDDGFLDDSVRGARKTISLERDANGLWKVVSSTEEFRCWEGRGHTDFGTKPCI